jgi:hypothetical protein
MGLSVSLIAGSAPPEKAGAASALQQSSGDFGLAVGIAALCSLGTTVYRDGVAGELPADTPAGVADASRDTLALTMLRHVPPPTRPRHSLRRPPRRSPPAETAHGARHQ